MTNTPKAEFRRSEELPFVFDNNFWNVIPSGDHQEDRRMGAHYARLLVKWMHEHRGRDALSMLGYIVLDMPPGEEHKGLKLGFFGELAHDLLKPYPDVEEIARAVERGTAVADIMAVLLEEEGVVVPEVRRASPVDAMSCLIHEFSTIEAIIEKDMAEWSAWRALAAETKEVTHG